MLGFNGYLDDPIQLILEDAVSRLDIFQLIAMGDQRGGIDFACFDKGKAFMGVPPRVLALLYHEH